MKADLEGIIAQLEKAKSHVLELKDRHVRDAEAAEAVEDVELAINWAVKKLRALSDGTDGKP